MKQYWKSLILKVEALNMRERSIVFVMLALGLVTFMNKIFLDPILAKQATVSQKIKQDQEMIANLQLQAQQKAKLQQIDPDAENKALLQNLTGQSEKMHQALHELQKGLVPPDKMTSLLEELLTRNINLRLISLKTLSSAGLIDPDQERNSEEKNNEGKNSKDKTGKSEKSEKSEKGENKAVNQTTNQAANQALVSTVYKHGVEIVLQGNYLDMLSYMMQLEKMPWQLYWGKVKLDTEGSLKATLTLTLYTLSLDKKWLNI